MSSWIRHAKGKVSAKLNARPVTYGDTSSHQELTAIFLDVLANYIYFQRVGEITRIYDPTNLVKSALVYNPQLSLLTERPKDGTLLSQSSLVGTLKSLSFSEIKKYATGLLIYNPTFQKYIKDILEKAFIRSVFDFGVHITNVSANNFQEYLDVINEYQKKTRKQTLSIYVKTDSYKEFQEFQKVCNSSWKLTTLSNVVPKNLLEKEMTELSEIQIFAIVPAAILDLHGNFGKYAYLMHRNPKGYEFFTDLNKTPWSLY
jgi:hypothetical protein